MFDLLSDKLQNVFKNLRGYGKLTEKNIADAMREVRVALLEADVNYKVAKDFIERTKQRALGREVLDSITPGQQIVKIVHDELVTLMTGQAPAAPTGAFPSLSAPPKLNDGEVDHWMMVGLHGCGKTTTSDVGGVRRVPPGCH
jgi:signal recognition particle subunit SRP54